MCTVLAMHMTPHAPFHLPPWLPIPLSLPSGTSPITLT